MLVIVLFLFSREILSLREGRTHSPPFVKEYSTNYNILSLSFSQDICHFFFVEWEVDGFGFCFFFATGIL